MPFVSPSMPQPVSRSSDSIVFGRQTIGDFTNYLFKNGAPFASVSPKDLALFFLTLSLRWSVPMSQVISKSMEAFQSSLRFSSGTGYGRQVGIGWRRVMDAYRDPLFFLTITTLFPK